jgi:diguanylate cyclase (GGDEF)-like protein/PAS domain S-box-containing protein
VSAGLPKQALATIEALQRSERRFRALIENSADGIVLTDADGRLVYGSPGSGRTLGYGSGETIGRIAADMVHPDDRGAFQALIALASARPGVAHDMHVRVRHKDGSYRVVHGSVTDLCADESVGAIVLNYRDITENDAAQAHARRMSMMYAALSAANEAILRAASADEIFRSACDIAVETGGFLLATVFTLDVQSGLLQRVAASGPVAGIPDDTQPSVDPRNAGGSSLIGYACRSGEPQICNDYQNDPRTAGRRLLKRGYTVGAAAVYPLRIGGRPVGVFGLQHGEKDIFTDTLAALLERFADNISFALENFEREERFRTVVDSANEGILVYDREHRIVIANAAAERIIGAAPGELIGKPGFTSLFRCVHEDGTPLAPHDRPTMVTARDGLPLTDRIVGLVRADGATTWVSVNTAFLRRPGDGGYYGLVSTVSDVTLQREAERRARLHAQCNEGLARLGEFALRAADLDQVFGEAVRMLRAICCDVAAVVEQTGPYEFLMRAAAGEGSETAVGQRNAVRSDSKWPAAIEGGSTVVSERAHYQSRSTERPWAFWRRRMGSGVYVPVHGERAAFGVLSMNSLRDQAFDEEDLRFAEAVANVLSGAIRRLQTQTRLAYMAEFDALTGLPNRNLLRDRLTQTVAQVRRRSESGGVLFIDLDRFKLINDTLGHHLGDALIAEVGERLKHCVRSGDTVGRVSGDEFAVVLCELARADDAAIVAQKILNSLARPFDLEGNEAYITASIGISVFPADGEDAETLLKNADLAMYRSKEMTRNAYCFFTAEMNRRSVAKLQLYTDLRRAIERREFVLHYQPKVDLREGQLLGVETLLRWNHPQRGVVTPEEFIPALEDSGLILPVGEWVLREACAQLRQWQKEGLHAVPVAVNLSAKQFLRPDLDALVRRVLASEGVAPHLIELEITESCLMSDPEEAVRLLAGLRAAGLKISVDDFGTGYSSLSYLTRLPLTALKIDHSFVRDAASSREAASIVRAVIDMAHNLHFTVIAEGVETQEQVDFLRRHGCDLGQGYLFGRPMPAAEFAARLSRAA